MKKYSLEDKNPLIKRFAELIQQSEYANNFKGLSIKAKVGETTVRDIIADNRTTNPGLRTLEKILSALGKDWSDIVESSAEEKIVHIVQKQPSTLSNDSPEQRISKLEQAVIMLSTSLLEVTSEQKAMKKIQQAMLNREFRREFREQNPNGQPKTADSD